MPELEDSRISHTSQEVFDTEKALHHDVAESKSNALWTYLTASVDPAKCTQCLAAFSFMTGFMSVLLLGQLRLFTESFDSDVISFSAIWVWCGFQTGNFIQVKILADVARFCRAHLWIVGFSYCSSL
jgi:hypothetical protein